MEERGGATNKHTRLTHVKIKKKERGGALRILKKRKKEGKKAARSGLFRQKFLPVCLKAAACYFRSVTGCWCHIKQRGGGGRSPVFCFWRGRVVTCKRSISQLFVRVRPEHDAREGGILSPCLHQHGRMLWDHILP